MRNPSLGPSLRDWSPVECGGVQIQSVGILGLSPCESPGQVGVRCVLEELDASAVADGDELSFVLLL